MSRGIRGWRDAGDAPAPALLLADSLTDQQFDGSSSASPAVEHVVDAITYFVVFLFSTTLHEAAHAWAALRGGNLTAYKGGQVTLDPRPHIKREPFGMVVLPLVSALAT